MNNYLVWSNEHSAWWGPDHKGYRAKIEDAGRYTRDEALAICTGARGGREYNSNPTEVPLLLDDALAFWGDDKDEWEIARTQRRRELEDERERQWAALFENAD